jgi:GntR family transcriptional regulator
MPRELRLPIERVTEDLRRRIDAGEWKPGEALPSTAELAEHYEVSRALTGKAIKTLAAEGKLVTRPRWGAFIPGEAAGSG